MACIRSAPGWLRPASTLAASAIYRLSQFLEELGVLGEIKKFAAYKPGVNFVDNTGKKQSVWCFKNVIKDKSHLSFHCLRAPFDNALLRNAEKHGATVLEEYNVKNVNLDLPTGLIEVETESSLEKKTFSGKFFLDASGQNSFLGKKLGVRKTFKGLDRTAFFCHWLNNNYDSALREGLIKIIYLGGEKQGWLWVIPVGADHLSIGVSLNNAYVKEKKKNYNKSSDNWQTQLYLDEIKEALVLEPILKNARQEHDVLTVGDYSYYNEKKFGKNYAMIGDAASFLDPIFSSGIYVAFETADMVTKTVIENFSKTPAEMEGELARAFKEIDGAYQLIEKFIRLFYTPEIVNFAHIGSSTKMEYEGFLDAYNIFHYLISGDFFTNYKHYSDFLDQISSEKTFRKFLNLTKSTHNELISPETCGETFESIYGHLKD